jgi:hypothetical protein
MTDCPPPLEAPRFTAPFRSLAPQSALFLAAPATAQESAPAFIGSTACAECHKEAAKWWAGLATRARLDKAGGRSSCLRTWCAACAWPPREILDTPVARLPQAIAGDLRAAMADRQAAFANRLDFPRHICSWEAWR